MYTCCTSRVTARAAFSSVISNEASSCSSATVEIITAHTCWHSWMDQENRRHDFVRAKQKRTRVKSYRLSQFWHRCSLSGSTGLKKIKTKQNKKKTGWFNIWKRVKIRKHQTCADSKPYTESLCGCTTSPRVKGPPPWVCAPPVSPPEMEWWWWESSESQ